MLILNRIVKDAKLQRALHKEVHAASARAYHKGIVLPVLLHAELVASEQGEGGRVGNEFFITAPYRFVQDAGRLKWYVAHELAHVWQASRNHHGEPLKHDAEFYRAFKALCARSVIHYELQYRPSAHERHGVPKLRKR